MIGEQKPKPMPKKDKASNPTTAAVGDKIATKVNGEVVGAIITSVEGGKITACQIIGSDFTVEGEFIPLAE